MQDKENGYADAMAAEILGEEQERREVLAEIRQTTAAAIAGVPDHPTRIALKQLFLYVQALDELS